jgi:hypothetical protein
VGLLVEGWVATPCGGCSMLPGTGDPSLAVTASRWGAKSGC